MSKNVNKVYFDSCCFIDIVSYDSGATIDKDRESHIWYCINLLKASQNEQIQVYTSLLTITECLAVKNLAGEKIITDEVKRLFNSVLLSGRGGVTTIEPVEMIVLKARDLRWSYDIKLKGAMDMIHVASAIEVECDEFITTDKDRFNNEIDNLKKLGLNVLFNAKETKYLPEEYRQLKLGNEKEGFQK